MPNKNTKCRCFVGVVALRRAPYLRFQFQSLIVFDGGGSDKLNLSSNRSAKEKNK